MPNFFEYQRRMAIIIGNSDYSLLREKKGYENYHDIPEVIEDVDNVTEGVKRLGFQQHEIMKMVNLTYKEIVDRFKRIMQLIQLDGQNGFNTLVYVYYAGHGQLEANTCIVMNSNSEDDSELSYPLEKILRIIAKMKYAYVFTLLDCCRTLVRAQNRGPDSCTSYDDSDDFDQKLEDLFPKKENQLRNYLVTYGCAPSEGVPAKSTVALSYFKHIKKTMNKNGHVFLPGSVMLFSGADGKAETVAKVSQQCVLSW